MSNSTKQSLNEAMKAAMRAKDKARLSVIRMALSEFKRIEVDERIEVEEARAVLILDKMVKQRRDAHSQYEAAGRNDLAEQEAYEVTVLQEFLPSQLSTEELLILIKDAIASTGAASMQDMGKVMGLLKSQVQGRADMGEVSKLIKANLG